MKLTDLDKQPGDKDPRIVPGLQPRWEILESDLLNGERILLLFDKQFLALARKEHPDLVVYFPPEIAVLNVLKDSPEDILKFHLVKRMFKAWILPPQFQAGLALESAGQGA